MAESSLYNSNGVEKPTHTTPHNQVIVAEVAPPSGELLDNYLRLKKDLEASWEDIAKRVEGQDPILADFLRDLGPKHEAAVVDKPGIAPVLTERAINPLMKPAERDAVAEGAPIGSVEAEQADEPAFVAAPESV